MTVLMLAALSWGADTCDIIGLADITAVEAPAVIVLGERYGTQPDLKRAGRVVRGLVVQAPVTLALEAVDRDLQSVLDDFADDKITATDLPGLLDWDARWGFPWHAYASLVTSAEDGASVIAAGLPYGPRPKKAQAPLPPNYMRVLHSALGGAELPAEQEPGFIQAMAWRDHAIARAATERWDGEGYLVILTGRAHVEGGLGVSWQAQRMVDVPVHSFVLAWARPPCFKGDKIWHPGLFERRKTSAR